MKQCMGCMETYSDEFNVCPHCGYIEGTQAEEAIHINPGQMIIGRYIVGKVLGYGGFGVTYIGWDTKLQQKVAIKEYLPTEFSTRLPGQTRVTVMSGEKSEQFFDGLEKFVEEAKRLAKFQNEDGIVKVFDSFTENETAYIVMEYLDGETLTAYMEREGTIPENDAVKMLEPVMNSLQVVHEAGILHRDIAPDNIFITKSGEVKLIDFGASRYATTSHSRSLTVIIKQGYSPEEQYRSRGDQGPHTDVYSLSATLYKMITGITPPDAMKRRASFESKNKDILEEPHRINKDISINRENAILNALNVRIEDRTPDIATFYRELHSDKPAKRLYGKIKKLDLYSWPLWAKIVVPTVAVAIITFAVLLLTGVIKFESFFSDVVEIPEGMTTVPGVEGMTIEEAEDELEKAGLLYSLDRNVESEYVEPGKVLLQNPNEGSYLEINGTVSLAVSRGSGVESPVGNEATVPFLTACTLEEAKELLSEAGLGEPIIEYQESDSVPAGQVISQSAEFGEKLETGTQITLVISNGPTKRIAPDLVGKTKEEATLALEELGLTAEIQQEYSAEVAADMVISQNIPAETSVTKGTAVIIVVSMGAETTTTTATTTTTTTAFNNETPASYLIYEIVNNEAVICGMNFNYLNTLVIPSSIEGYPVTRIDEGAFYGCNVLTSITIPSSITSIGNGAFAYCHSLTAINVDSSSNSYCSVDGVLYNINKTKLIRYPQAKTEVFFAIPNGVVSIEDHAFDCCDNLQTITMPTSVTSIGYMVFYKFGDNYDVYYAGTREKWDAITIGEENWSFDLYVNGSGSNTVTTVATTATTTVTTKVTTTTTAATTKVTTTSTAVTTTTAATTATTTQHEEADVSANAYMFGVIGTGQCWAIDEVNANSTAAYITGDGQYAVEWVIDAGEGTEIIQFLAVCIASADTSENFSREVYPNMSIVVDEVLIDGVKFGDYQTSENAIDYEYYEGGTGVVRIYLFDEWAGSGVDDIPSDTFIDNSIKVVFTISGLS